MRRSIIFAALLLAACGSTATPDSGNADSGTSPDGGDGVIGFSVLWQRYMAPASSAGSNCGMSGCHDVGTKSGGQQLDTQAAAYASVMSSSTENPALHRIKPFDAANSYLIQKLKGIAKDNGGHVTAQMPLALTPLTDTQIGDFISWVDAGALNN